MPASVDRARSGSGRLRRTSRRWTPRTFALVGLACGGALLAITIFAQVYGFSDLDLHRSAVRSWLAGDGLYAYRSTSSNLGYPLPPAAALFLLPAAALPLTVAGWAAALAGLAALILALIALVGPVARRYGRRRGIAVAVAVGLALLVEPVRAALGLGHLDLLLFGLITADVVALRRRAWARSRAAWWPGRPASALSAAGARSAGALSTAGGGRSPTELLRRCWATGGWAGFGTGIASAIGVSPVIFIGYLAVTRQWRATLIAAGTTVGIAVLAFVVAPRESAAWLTDVLWRIDRNGPVDETANQSLAGLLARLYDSSTTPVLLWLSFAVLLLAVGIIRARSAHADGDEIAAFTLVALTSAAIGPVTDTHELIWVLPAVLILVDAAARRRSTRVMPGRRGITGRRNLRSSVDGGGARWGPTALRARLPMTGSGQLAAAVAVYLLFAVAPLWAYEHRLPEQSHRSDGLWGVLVENIFALVLILLVSALPWRPGAAPAFPSTRWLPPARRHIPPARRPTS